MVVKKSSKEDDMDNMKVFAVIVHCDNDRTETYNCVATDDYYARPMGIAAMRQGYIDAGVSAVPEVVFCEVRLVCYIDVLPQVDVVKSDPIPESKE
jgi:hypothetical protein